MTSASSPATGTTLSASDNATLVSQGINLPVGGSITISGEVTVAALFAQGASEIRFADENSSLTVSGPVYVAGSNRLTITPTALTTTDKAKTLISASVIGSVSNVSVSVPTESGYRYVPSVGDKAVTLIRYKDIGLDYTATPVGGFYAGSTWFTSFGNYSTPEAYRVGPSTTYPAVSEVKADTFNPYQNYTAALPFSFAIYADLSEMAENTIIMAFGTQSNGIIMYKNGNDGGNVRVGRATNGNISGYVQVARPNSGKGYHLYTVTCAADGSLNLYVDDGTVKGSGTIATDALATGFQIGSIYGGGDNISWLSAGNNMAVAKILGWNGVLSAEDVAALAQEYPATTGTIDRNISWNNSGKTLKVYSSEEDSTACNIDVDAGAVTIVSGEKVSVSKLRTQPSGIQGEIGESRVTVAGTLNINGSDSTIGSNPGDASICLGYWVRPDQSGAKTTALTVASGGVLNAPDAYVQIPWATHCQGAEFNVSGTAKIKGLYSHQSGKGTVTLANGGVLEVAEILSSGQPITKNFRYGTFRITADAEETRAINFSAVSGYATTLDPNGHTLTMAAAAMTGSAAVTVGGSNGGTVHFKGFTSSFTGEIQFSDANKYMIQVDSWENFAGTLTGTLTVDDTNKDSLLLSTFPWDRFSGNINYAVTDGTLDLRGYDKSSNTINVTGSGATVLLTAGQEGMLNVSSGATAELYTDADTYYYLGHVYGSGMVEGTLVYKFTADSGVTYSAVAADAYNGNNLLPYYYVWTPSETASENTINANAAARWKVGSLPTANKNVAFKISGATTVLVDATVSYGDVQVYGTGTLTFQSADGTAAMTVAKKLQTTSMTAVQIDGGIEFGANAGLEVVSTLPAYMSAINCGTEETPYSIPSITGGGIAYVAENKYLSAGEVELGTFYVMGNATISESAAIGSLTVPASGLLTLDSANVSVSGTATIDGTVNVDSASTFNPSAVSGDGRVKYTGKRPDGSAWATGTTTTGWRGTIAVSSWDSSGSNQWTPANYGNAYSMLEVDDCNVYYFDGSDTTTTLPTLKLVGNLTINNGGSSSVNVFAGLSGTGTLKCGTGSVTQTLKFGTVEDFAGSINNVSFKVVVGTSDGEGKTITIESGYAFNLASGKSLKSDSIKLNGTLNVAGTGILEGAVTAANSAKIVLNDSPLTISGTLTATALEVDPGAIALSTTPTAIITGLTAAPTITGLTVENCDITTGEVDGKYVIYAAYKDTAWSGESGDWTEASFNGGALETDGEDVSFVAGASGAVAVTLTGTRAPVKVVFNGGSTSTYTLTGGTFSPSGTVTIESGSVTIESVATGTYVVNAGATLSLANATVTSVSGAGTLNIPAGGVVTISASDAISVEKLTGTGKLVVGANVPNATLQKLLKAASGEHWGGTLVFSGLTANAATQNFNFSNYGNADSKIQFTNCAISYLDGGSSNFAGELVLCDDASHNPAFATANGYSDKANDVGKLSGNGSISATANPLQIYRFHSASDFTGSITVTPSSYDSQNKKYSGRRIVFGTSPSTIDNYSKPSSITVDSGVEAGLGEGATWNAAFGIYVSGTLIVHGDSALISNGTLTDHADATNIPDDKHIVFYDDASLKYKKLATVTMTGDITVDAGDTVNIAFGDGVTPTAGTKLISWGGAPEGEFAFADSSLADNYCLVKTASGLEVAQWGVVTLTTGANVTSITGVANGDKVKPGDTVSFTVATADGYDAVVTVGNKTLTADNGTYSYTVAGDVTITVTTVSTAVTFGAATFDYYATYASAKTVTAAVSGHVVDGTTFTMTVGEKNYTGTYENGVVTFSDVTVGGLGTTTSYTISATGGSIGSLENQSATVGNVTDGWIVENSTNKETTGRWATDITYTGGVATITDANTYTPTKPGDGIVTLETVVKFGNEADPEVAVGDGAQAAVKIANGKFAVYGKATSDGTAGWQSTEVNADVDATYTVKLVINYNTGTFTISVKKNGAETATPLGSAWHLATAATKVSSIAYKGTGAFTSLNGSFISGDIDVSVETTDDVAVSSAFISKYLAGKTVTEAAAALNPNATVTDANKNGLNYFTNYALGLDPTKEEDKPIVDVTVVDGNYVFKVKHPVYNEQGAIAGYEEIDAADNVSTTVTLKYGTGAASLSGSATGAAISPAAMFSQEGLDGSNVIYYKAEVKIGAK